MQITIKDSLWSYCSQIFSIGWGIILLPIVLIKLSTEELAIYYILLTISSFITIFDFGFSPQLSRNVSYIFSGVKSLKKEGIENIHNNNIDYFLLSKVIISAEYIYNKIAKYLLFSLLFGGTIYFYFAINNFLNSDYIIIWGLFIISSYIKLKYIFYNSLLSGKGSIGHLQKITILYRVIYLFICILFLLLGFKLFSIVFAELISTIMQRYLAHKGFYTNDIKSKTKNKHISKKEIHNTFKILWYNSKKQGLTTLAGFIVNQSGLLFAGIYLSIEEVASYGLLVQLVTAIGVIASCLITIHLPYFSYCRAHNNNSNIINRFSITIILFYFIFIIGFLVLVFILPTLLKSINPKIVLPSLLTTSTYCLIRLLEYNHSNFASILASGNKIPYVKAALISGASTLIGFILVLNFTNYKLLGIILIPGIVQLVYQNWKWPQDVCKEFEISYISLLKIGLKNITQKANILGLK